jgi:mRNA interferase MazF
MVNTPHRGEIYRVNWDPARGSEQAGMRPALIVQNDVGNSTASTVVVVAITSRQPSKPYPFIVELVDAHLPMRSFANCSQLYTIDKMRLGRMMGIASRAEMRQVDEALCHELALPVAAGR